MTWPMDGQPRFKVTSEKNSGSHDTYMPARAYVLDRAVCHRIAAIHSSTFLPRAVAAAEATAAELERECAQ